MIDIRCLVCITYRFLSWFKVPDQEREETTCLKVGSESMFSGREIVRKENFILLPTYTKYEITYGLAPICY